MGLKPCVECSERISEKAQSCPKCGCPVVATDRITAAPAAPAAPRPRKTAAIVAIVAAVIGLGLGVSGAGIAGEAMGGVGMGPVVGLLAAVIAVVAVIVGAVRRNLRALLVPALVLTIIALGVTGVGTTRAVIAVRAAAKDAQVASVLRSNFSACTVFWGKRDQQWPASLTEAVTAVPAKGASAVHPATQNAGDFLYLRPSPRDRDAMHRGRPLIVENPRANHAGNMTVVFGDGHVDVIPAKLAPAVWSALSGLMQTEAATRDGVTANDIEGAVAHIVAPNQR